MTVEFQGEGKYDSQWDAWDDGFTVQAELINDLHADIRRLRAIETAAREVFGDGSAIRPYALDDLERLLNSEG